MIRHSAFLIKARPLQGYMDFQGLPISVENRRGNIRSWYDPNEDREGHTRMQVPYGYIRGTIGSDGDAYDVFVGPHRDAKYAYIVRQMKAPEFTEYDEEKAILGFKTQEDAKKLYLQHYSDPRFFGEIGRMPMEEFRAKVMKTREKGGELVKSSLLVLVHPSIDRMIMGGTRATMRTIDQETRVLVAAAGGAPADIDLTEFRAGYRAETEHRDVTGGDPVLTAKIVLAHLQELPNYYTRLAKMEKALSGAYLLRKAKGRSI